MMKKIAQGIGLFVIVALSLFLYHYLFEKKIAYVDIPKVFNAFEMKKELQENYKRTENARQRVLDSVSFNLQMLAKEIDAAKDRKAKMNEFELKRTEFFDMKKRMNEDNINLSNQYDKQILERMSQYIMDFGKERKYDIILGADGNGMLMYANEKLNISDEITEYLNNKYKGIE